VSSSLASFIFQLLTSVPLPSIHMCVRYSFLTSRFLAFRRFFHAEASYWLCRDPSYCRRLCLSFVRSSFAFIFFFLPTLFLLNLKISWSCAFFLDVTCAWASFLGAGFLIVLVISQLTWCYVSIMEVLQLVLSPSTSTTLLFLLVCTNPGTRMWMLDAIPPEMHFLLMSLYGELKTDFCW